MDQINGNNLWKEAEERELAQINQYDTFKDLGLGANPPPGYKNIKVHYGL